MLELKDFLKRTKRFGDIKITVRLSDQENSPTAVDTFNAGYYSEVIKGYMFFNYENPFLVKTYLPSSIESIEVIEDKDNKPFRIFNPHGGYYDVFAPNQKVAKALAINHLTSLGKMDYLKKKDELLIRELRDNRNMEVINYQ